MELYEKNLDTLEKKDTLLINNMINPEKEPVMMTVMLHRYPGPEMRVRIDFQKNIFTYFEWHLDSNAADSIEAEPTLTVETFKKQLAAFKVWEWDEDYLPKGIIVDGISWSVKLKTNEKTYQSEGLNSFPTEWKGFCQAISKLIGKKFSF